MAKNDLDIIDIIKIINGINKLEISVEKHHQKIHLKSCIEIVKLKNKRLESQLKDLSEILKSSLVESKLSIIERLLTSLHIPSSPPKFEDYRPSKLTILQAWFPWIGNLYKNKLVRAKRIYLNKLTLYNRLINLKTVFEEGETKAIADYFNLVLVNSKYPDGFPKLAKTNYIHESKKLLVEYELPNINIIPKVKEYKYIKTSDSFKEVTRSDLKCKSIYSSVIAQTILRSFYELFQEDYLNYLETVIINGFVQGIDTSTGKSVSSCIVAVQSCKEEFNSLNLSLVNPIECLKHLHASFSKKPEHLVSVIPYS